MKNELIDSMEKMLTANLELVLTVKRSSDEHEKSIIIYQIIKNMNEMTNSILESNIFVES